MSEKGLTFTLDGEQFRRLLAEEIERAVAERLPAAPAPSAYMTVGEAASYLRCSRQRVFDLRSAGKLTPHKEGARALVARAEVEGLVRVGVRAPRRAEQGVPGP